MFSNRWFVSLLFLLAAMAAGCGDDDEVPTATPEASTPAGTPAETTEPSESMDPSPSPTQSAAASPVAQTYRNEKYGYEVALPADWRVATYFMGKFASRLSNPNEPAVRDDYSMLTFLSEDEEETQVDAAAGMSGVGLEPWLRVAKGYSIHIHPLGVYYGNITVDQLLATVHGPGVIKEVSDIQSFTTAAGLDGIRFTRREADDNGDITYDMAVIPLEGQDAMIIKIVRSGDYKIEDFEQVIASFRAPVLAENRELSPILSSFVSAVRTTAFELPTLGIAFEGPPDWEHLAVSNPEAVPTAQRRQEGQHD